MKLYIEENWSEMEHFSKNYLENKGVTLQQYQCDILRYDFEMDELFFSILSHKFHVHLVLLAFNGYWCTTQWISLSDCSIIFLWQGDKQSRQKFILTTKKQSETSVTTTSTEEPLSSFEKEHASFISSDDRITKLTSKVEGQHESMK